MVLGGHRSTVHCVAHAGRASRQVVTGSADTTVRTWDLVTGQATSILTHHKKGVRAALFHPECVLARGVMRREYVFATASADNIKKWKCPSVAAAGVVEA